MKPSRARFLSTGPSPRALLEVALLVFLAIATSGCGGCGEDPHDLDEMGSATLDMSADMNETPPRLDMDEEMRAEMDMSSREDMSPEQDMGDRFVWAAGASLDAIALDGQRVSLRWSDIGHASATGYRIYQDDLQIAQVPRGELSLGVSNLSPQTMYTFRVEAFGDPGETEGGPTARVTTLAPSPTLELSPSLIDPTAPTRFDASVEFLWDGPGAPQEGVLPGAIDRDVVGVIRGRVLDRSGMAIPNAVVTLLNEEALGQTRSREDGWFDIAANGGESVVVTVEHPAFLKVQRRVRLPERDWYTIEDIIVTPLDANVTTVPLTQMSQPVVARGSVIDDGDGARQLTMIFEPGTSATARAEDGSDVPLDTLSVRATEYTVGDLGPQAMPGPLPPTSAYTYAVELSVDEAMAMGATRVDFSKPVPFYLENFLSFPVGARVPTGSYDATQAKWIAEPDGLIIAIAGIEDGVAMVDLDGDGVAEDDSALDAIGLDIAEREVLAGLYEVGESLWRVEASHFTPFDCNFPWGLLDYIDALLEKLTEWYERFCKGKGSTIGCENQTMGQTYDVDGTGVDLVYSTERVPGYKVATSRTILLTPDEVTDNLLSVVLEVRVAGQFLREEFPPLPDQRYVFEWDGMDAYGRPLRGERPIRWRVGYVYEGVYMEAVEDRVASFGALPDAENVALSVDGTRQEILIWQEFEDSIGALERAVAGIGQWSFDIHHSYEPNSRTLHLGSGEQRDAQDTGYQLELIAGFDEGTDIARVVPGPMAYEDEGPITQRGLLGPKSMALDAEGRLVIAESLRIRRIDENDEFELILGSQFSSCHPSQPCTLEGPVGQVQVGAISAMDIDSLGRITYVDELHGRVNLIEGGQVRTIAGGPNLLTDCTGPDMDCAIAPGKDAFSVHMGAIQHIEYSADDTLYMSDDGTNVIWTLGDDGLIHAFAGHEATNQPDRGEGGPASRARFVGLGAIEFGPEGNLYVADREGNQVKRILPTGIIQTVFGDGIVCDAADTEACDRFDGLPAHEAHLGRPFAMAIREDASLFVFEKFSDHLIRQRDSEGIARTVAGVRDGDLKTRGSGGAASAASLAIVTDMLFDERGDLYILEQNAIRKMRGIFPQFDQDGYVIPDPSGLEVFEFDATGRHLATRDAYTGDTRSRFGYDADGWLITIEDAFGNLTTIERDADASPTAIIAPTGERTELALDARGMLSRVTNGVGDETSFTYTEDGLMLEVTHPTSHTSTYEYDARGRLTRAINPEGGEQTLERIDEMSGTRVVRAMGAHILSYFFSKNPTLNTHAITYPDATSATSRRTGQSSSISELRDGTIARRVTLADPLFGLAAPRVHTVHEYPSGLRHSVSEGRRLIYDDPETQQNILGYERLSYLTGPVPFIERFMAADRTLVKTTPAGRTTTITYNEGGAPLTLDLGDTSLGYTYTSRGLLETQSFGGGTTTFGYDARGRLISRTGPYMRTIDYAYDEAGRLTRESYSGSQPITYDHDAAGNVATVTLPGGHVHALTHDGNHNITSYTPPDLGDGQPSTTTYVNDPFDRLLRIERPSGRDTVYTYNNAAQLDTLSIPTATSATPKTLTWTYDPTTGQTTRIMDDAGDGIAFGYDGALTTRVQFMGAAQGVVEYTHDTRRFITEIKVDNDIITRGFDQDGLLTSAGPVTITRGSETGRIETLSTGQLVETRTYDAMGRLFTVSVTHPQSGRRYHEVLHYDLNQQITNTLELIEEAFAKDQSYTYDALWRIASVEDRTQGNEVTTFDYDARSNLTAITTPTSTRALTYNARDQVTSALGATYTHGPDGDLISRSDANGTTTYSHDGLLRLERVVTSDGTTIDYTLDPLGRRVARQVNGVKTHSWVYANGLSPEAEYDGSGALVSRFIYASRNNVPDAIIRNGVTYRVVTDIRGSVRLVIDAQTGQIAQRIDYDTFGQVLSNTAPGFQPFGFAGGLYDDATGLVHMGARDYDPVTGHWTTPDPSGFEGGSNQYAYVSGDPVNGIDPGGEVLPAIAIAAIKMGVASAVLDLAAGQIIDGFGSDPNICSAAIAFLAGAAGAGVGEKLTKLKDVGKIGGFLAGAGNVSANAILGGAGQTALNGLQGKPLGDGVIAGTVLGGLGALAGGNGGPGASRGVTRVMQHGWRGVRQGFSTNSGAIYNSFTSGFGAWGAD